MANNDWAPHAEKEWGRLTHALGKRLPAKLAAARRLGARTKALTATTHRKRGR